MKKEVIRAAKAPAAIGPYSHAVKAGGFVFVAGQGPLDPATGKLDGTDITTQTRRTLENVKAIIEAAGASLDDVVKVNVFITDAANFKPMNEVYRTYFREPYPARACVCCGLLLPGMLVEIEAVAYTG